MKMQNVGSLININIKYECQLLNVSFGENGIDSQSQSWGTTACG